MRPVTVALIVGLTAVAATPVGAQDGPTRSVQLRSYDAGAVHRFFLGSLHRNLWSIPIQAVELDLAGYAGGLTPTRRGGGLQTRSLRFDSGEGPVYTFRSIEKDATRNLDPQLQNSLAATVLQDQIGALFPLSAMVVAPLLEAADVLHATPELVVLPDSPRLGEFREDYAGLVGWIEVRPDEGPDGEPAFAGADRVTSTPTFLERLEEEPKHQVDAEAFLRARLMDLYVGDWDRHPDQWRWAAFEESDDVTRWYPIPRDRDWALNNINGVFWSLVRRTIPQYVSFGPEYVSVFGTVWNGRALDRQLLSELTWSDWTRTVQHLQGALSDRVIEDAVSVLPAGFEDTAEEVATALRARRDGLLAAAREYYDMTAERVDVFTTDEPEFAHIERAPDGSVRLRVTELRRGRVLDDAPFFDRTFSPEETAGIRLYLRGARDSVVVEGASGDIWVRVIGGGGDDSFQDLTGGRRVGFYDDRGDNTFLPAADTEVDADDYEEPEDTESATHQARARDWGTRWVNYPLLGANQDVGAYLGSTLWWNRYGFRRFPHQQRLELDWVLNPVNFGFQLGAAWRQNLSHEAEREWVTSIVASSRNVRYFHGIGNNSGLQGDSEFHRADRAGGRLASGLEFSRDRAHLQSGVALRYSEPIESEDPRLIQSLEPMGLPTAWQGEVFLNAEVDGRDSEVAPTRGAAIGVELMATPALLDISDAYGRARVHVTGSTSAGPFVFTGFSQAERVLGDAPYYDLAALGGAGSLRGFRQERFLGDGALLGGAEVRFPVTPFFAFFPGTIGLSGFAEIGRVFSDFDGFAVADGAEPTSTQEETWHPSYGGGVWVSLVSSEYTLNVTLARSDEGNRLYFGLGFGR